MKTYITTLCYILLIFTTLTACGRVQSHITTTEEVTLVNDGHNPSSKTTPTAKFDTPTTNRFNSYSGSIYYLVAEGTTSGLWRIDLPDRHKVQLRQDNNITGFDVEISPDGNWIAYSNDTWNEQQERLTNLWVVNTRSQEVRQVSPFLPLVRWRWLPNSDIFYTQYLEYSEGDPILGELPEPGRNIKSFICDLAANSQMEAPNLRIPWSYQGDQLCGYQPSPSNPKLLAKVCRSITDKTPERPLVVTQINGSNAVTITTQFTGSSIWSPDGQQLLFSNAPDKNRQLFVWDSRTNETRQITDTSQQFSFFDLTWSPDKQWVAFHENNNEGVCVVNLTTGKITCYSGYRFPVGQKMSWSPDSQAIVIAAVSDINSNPRENDLYLISVPEGHITRLTEDTSQFEYNPIWVE